MTLKYTVPQVHLYSWRMPSKISMPIHIYTHETIKNIEQIFILYFISGIFIKICPPTPVQLKPDNNW